MSHRPVAVAAVATLVAALAPAAALAGPAPAMAAAITPDFKIGQSAVSLRKQSYRPA
jgi:hypothetical protein